MSPAIKREKNIIFVLWILCLGATLWISFVNTVGPFVPFFYIGSIVFFYLFIRTPNKFSFKKTFPLEMFIVIIISIVGILYLYSVDKNPTHFHQDEFVHAIASLRLPDWKIIQWFSGYPPDYLARFPVHYYAMQKLVFLLFNSISIVTMRISQWPAYILTVVALFYIGKKFGGLLTACISSLIFITFAANVYFSSLALPNTLSMCVTTLAVLCFIHFMQHKSNNAAAVFGIACGACFSGYPGSYIVPPILFMLLIIEASYIRSMKFFVSIALAACMFLVVVAPFFIYAFTKENYFLERVNQVNFLNGSWSDVPKQLQQGVLVQTIIFTQIHDAFWALVMPHIGGLGGFNFGGQALFDMYTAALLTGSIIAGIIYLKERQKRYFIYILILIAVTMFTGYVFTTHPPPFHRLTILFPLIALCIGIGITWMIHISHKFKFFILGMSIGYFILTNYIHLNTMIKKDVDIYPLEPLYIEQFIEKNVPPETTIYVAGYPAYHLCYELVFRLNNNYPVMCDTKSKILPQYASDGLLIVFEPTDDLTRTLRQQYPYHQIVTRISNKNLYNLLLLVPETYNY